MKYFFISDVHGAYDKMIDALNEYGFNKQTDTLVNVGDSFDRGPDSLKVLEFLLSCPNRILIWGNHDLRLADLVLGLSKIHNEDFINGVDDTINSFYGDEIHGKKQNITLAIQQFRSARPQVYSKLLQYFSECVYAAEWKELIATHAWLPIKPIYDFNVSLTKPVGFVLRKDWRNIDEKEKDEVWSDATWYNSLKLSLLSNTMPDKPLLIGHFHAWRLAEAHGENRFDEDLSIIKNKVYYDCSTFMTSVDGRLLIGIDGCSNWDCGGKVNVFLFESETPPIFYK